LPFFLADNKSEHRGVGLGTGNTMFRILWGVDVVAALVALAFFFIGIEDGTVSSFNIMLWLALLGAVLIGIGCFVLVRKFW
jgi:multisubunit Na+/H+ antiporter MnhF subunit